MNPPTNIQVVLYNRLPGHDKVYIVECCRISTTTTDTTELRYHWGRRLSYTQNGLGGLGGRGESFGRDNSTALACCVQAISDKVRKKGYTLNPDGVSAMPLAGVFNELHNFFNPSAPQIDRCDGWTTVEVPKRSVARKAEKYQPPVRRRAIEL